MELTPQNAAWFAETFAKLTDNVGQALLGTLLFHTLFVVSPLAGKNLMGNVQVGEYFRVFVSYGVIGIALALHAWKHAGEDEFKE